MLLAAVAVRRDRLEPSTISGGNLDFDPRAHAATVSHPLLLMGPSCLCRRSSAFLLAAISSFEEAEAVRQTSSCTLYGLGALVECAQVMCSTNCKIRAACDSHVSSPTRIRAFLLNSICHL
jgi:hypothetical protein